MLNRIATVKHDGTVEVLVPSNIEPFSLDVGHEDTYDEAVDEEPLESTDLQYIPPLQIVILIVGTRGDVQPFVAIGKRLQVSIKFVACHCTYYFYYGNIVFILICGLCVHVNFLAKKTF